MMIVFYRQGGIKGVRLISFADRLYDLRYE
jgi:hypothetical protein